MTPTRRQAVAYARVSSKEQEREGFSIPSQLKLLRGHAQACGVDVVCEFVDVETAKEPGRANFSEMLSFLEREPSCRLLLVEKTDRLYRNLKDWVSIDDVDLEIHFVKENVVLSPDSRSTEKFMHGIRVLMAKNYIDNLGEEVSKGLREKAEEGLWPSFAPLGYLNIEGADHRRLIVPDPDRAPLVAQLFEWYASGDYSLKEVGQMARQAGFTFRKSGAPIPTATAHRLLRKRIYTGDFEWKGRLFRGTHPPIVSRDLWQRVQDVLDGRATKRPRRRHHQFAFGGLIQCGHCGCSMVGETKKGRYVYYHCTGYRGTSPEPYAREELIERQFSELQCLHMRPDVLAWVTRALRESQRDEKRFHEQALARLQASTTSSTNVWNRCTWTSWTAGSAPPSTTVSQPNGGRSRSGCKPQSRSTARPTGPTSTSASGSRSWPAAPTSCS
jgi:DNA invertase Pin-like site-specific DNA recombinase